MCNDQVRKSDQEPTPQWYRRTGFRFGNIKLHVAAAILHIIWCLVPLGFAISMGEAHLVEIISAWAKDYPWVSCFWISFVALGHPGWIWWETMEFENWVRMKPEAQRKVERAHYQLHVGLARNFWQAVMYMYTAAGLIGAALKAATSPE